MRDLHAPGEDLAVVEAITVIWRKSGRSTQNGRNGNCVEVAFTGSEVAERSWSAFLHAVR
jgi:uncharacterized protein DUF397